MSDVPDSDSDDENQTLPRHAAIKKVAVVQCAGFRCLAYREQGTEVWRDVETGEELPKVQSVVFEFAV